MMPMALRIGRNFGSRGFIRALQQPTPTTIDCILYTAGKCLARSLPTCARVHIVRTRF